MFIEVSSEIEDAVEKFKHDLSVTNKYRSRFLKRDHFLLYSVVTVASSVVLTIMADYTDSAAIGIMATIAVLLTILVFAAGIPYLLIKWIVADIGFRKHLKDLEASLLCDGFVHPGVYLYGDYVVFGDCKLRTDNDGNTFHIFHESYKIDKESTNKVKVWQNEHFRKEKDSSIMIGVGRKESFQKVEDTGWFDAHDFSFRYITLGDKE